MVRQALDPEWAPAPVGVRLLDDHRHDGRG